MKVARNNDKAYEMAMTRTDFRNSRESLSGKWTDYTPHRSSWLQNDKFWEAVKAAVAEGPTFLVYSYGTVVGFVTDDMYVEDSEKHSVTTTRHQSGYRLAASQAGLEVKTI